jgi:hypothetical protein
MTASWDEIYDTISEAYKAVPVANSAIEDFGWRPLRVKTRSQMTRKGYPSKREKHILRPFDPTTLLSMHAWEV